MTFCDQLLESLPVGVLVFEQGPDERPVCIRASRQFLSWAEGDEGAVLGLSPADMPLIGSQPALHTEIKRILSGKSGGKAERKWSARRPKERHYAAQVSRFGDASSRRAIVVLRDRAAENFAEQHLRMTMLSDDLTGIPNRLAFTEHLEEVIAEDPASTAVLIINVDRFSRINESLGTTVGDEFLIAIARRLTACVRDRDCVARFGGDEFAIMLPHLRDMGTANEVIDRIHEKLEDPFTLSGGELYATATIGLAYATVGQTAEELLHQADYALRSAKGSGGQSAVETYTERDHSHEIGLFHLEVELRRAIERDELQLAYQPLVDLTTGEMVGVEALSRWDCEGRGPVPPGDFIPLAEESGLIVPLGRQALFTACEQLAFWRREIPAARNLHVAVNVSGVQLRRDDIVATVGAALENAKLPGEALKIELTESAIVREPERVREVFHKLKALGCQIAMDDFGTGYSSLSYLQTFPIDVLKIDQSFVAGMLENEDSQNIIDAILSLSRALHMSTVAEGVETELQMRALKAAGCEVGQGFYFARPLSEEDLIAHLGRTV